MWICIVFLPHKMYGLTGVGVLYGKEDILNEIPPYQGGGEMIKDVSFEKQPTAVYHKFEMGTPNIAGEQSFKSAIEFISDLGFNTIVINENNLLEYILRRF